MERLLTYLKQLSTRKMLIVAAVGLGVAVLLFAAVPRLSDAMRDRDNKAAAEAYKKSLESQVNTPSGEPRDGRDPSSQRQTSLAEASAAANGNGKRTDKPAAGVSGTTGSHASHSDVYGDPSKTGVNSAGCYVDYGIPGQQCLAVAVAGSDGVPTCDEVRTKFTHGIKVSGTDRFHLDHNGDGTACGHGE